MDIYLNYRMKSDKLKHNQEAERAFIKGRIVTAKYDKDKFIHDVNLSQKMVSIVAKYLNHSRLGDLSYHTFEIPKRSGGTRTITAPNDSLKRLQREVLTTLSKDYKWLPHNAAHGFTAGRNCKTALEVHKSNKSRWFLKIDIHNFFPSVTADMLNTEMQMVYPFCYMTERTRDVLINLATIEDPTHARVLPQGSPLSPLLGNLVMVRKDIAITRLCKAKGLIYTRYADDILISSPYDFNWEQIQNEVVKILDPFCISAHKTRYGSFNGRNWNLGIMYNNKYELTLGHKFKEQTRCAVHNCLVQEEVDEGKVRTLIGQIAYARYIEPTYQKYDEWLEQLTLLLKRL